MTEQEEKIVEALAEYYDTEPEEIVGFVIACERETPQGTVLSTNWSNGTPFWHILAYTDEARYQVERNHRIPQPSGNGVAAPRDHQQKSRGRRGRG